MWPRSACLPLAAGVVLVSAIAGFDLSAQDHVGQYAQTDIARGSQVYAEECTTCHGADGSNVGTVNLAQGRFRLATSDDDLKRLIQAGIPSAGMPPTSLEGGDLTALVAFIRAGLDVKRRAVAVAVGDAARGRMVFEGKGACLRCHRVRGEGSAVAPDLTNIGGSRTPATLQMSLIDPTAVMRPINRPIRAVTRDGTVVRGRRLNEDSYSVQAIDEHGRLVTLLKSDLREYEISTVSPMPSYGDELTKDEMADLLGYLLSLREN